MARIPWLMVLACAGLWGVAACQVPEELESRTGPPDLAARVSASPTVPSPPVSATPTPGASGDAGYSAADPYPGVPDAKMAGPASTQRAARGYTVIGEMVVDGDHGRIYARGLTYAALVHLWRGPTPSPYAKLLAIDQASLELIGHAPASGLMAVDTARHGGSNWLLEVHRLNGQPGSRFLRSDDLGQTWRPTDLPGEIRDAPIAVGHRGRLVVAVSADEFRYVPLADLTEPTGAR